MQKTSKKCVHSQIQSKSGSQKNSSGKLKPLETKKLFNLANITKFAINDDLKKKISFRETLVVGVFNPGETIPSPVGGMCLDVDVVDDKFAVYLSSHIFVENIYGGSKISSWLDSGLHTLEEKRYEYIRDENSLYQNLYLGMHQDTLYIRHISTNFIEKRLTYTLSDIKLLICEGSNIVLMRCLAVQKYVGTIEFTTLYINGDLCQNIYKCTGPEFGMVNGKRIQICKIYRKIIEKCGIVHNSCTTMTLMGQIICQDWENCPYSFYINPLVTIQTDHLINAENLPLKKIWKKELELFSKYLDRKKFLNEDINTYIEERIEVKDLLSDYVTKLLQVQPSRAFDFTLEYFRNFN